MGNPMNGDIYEGVLRPGDVELDAERAAFLKQLALVNRMKELEQQFRAQGGRAAGDDGPSREMPRYKCHKEVWALKIAKITRDGEDENRETDGSAIITPADEGYAPFRVEYDYLRKHNPQIGGYFVVYRDGYKSYSPRKPFEEGYARL